MNKIYWQIFWKTFAQLAASGLLAYQGYNVVQGNGTANLATLGFVLLAAALGAVVATGTAYWKSPATTAIQKAIRSGVQALTAGIATWALNSWQNVVSTEKLLIPLAISVGLAFAITYFQNAGTTTPVVTP